MSLSEVNFDNQSNRSISTSHLHERLHNDIKKKIAKQMLNEAKKMASLEREEENLDEHCTFQPNVNKQKTMHVRGFNKFLND